MFFFLNLRFDRSKRRLLLLLFALRKELCAVAVFVLEVWLGVQLSAENWLIMLLRCELVSIMEPWPMPLSVYSDPLKFTWFLLS